MENIELILKDLGSVNFECRRSAAARLCEAAYGGENLSRFYTMLGRLLEDPDISTRCNAAGALTYSQLMQGDFKNAIPLLAHPDYYVKDNAARALADYYMAKPDFGNVEYLLQHPDKVVTSQTVWRLTNYIATCSSIGKLQLLKQIVKASANGYANWLSMEIVERQRLIADRMAEVALRTPHRMAKSEARPQEKLAARRMG